METVLLRVAFGWLRDLGLAGHSARLSLDLTYTIHPNSRALSLASFQARARNCARVIGPF